MLKKILLGLVGVLLIIGGVEALFNPVEAFAAMAGLWAVLMLLGGIALIVLFFKEKEMPGRGFLLFAAIVQLLLALMLIGNGIGFTTIVALNVLQIWIIFAGISGIVGCFELKKAGVQMWWLDLILGILLLIIGLSSASSAVANITMTAAAVGFGLIVSGVGFITKIFQK